MICPKCDRDLPDDAVLCCYCGRTIIRKAPARTHQRPNGSGSAYKRGKTWTARVTAGWRVDENDVKHQRWKTKGGFKTKAEALAYCDKLNRTDYKNAKKAPKLSEYWDIYEKDDLEKLSKDKICAYKIAWRRLKSIETYPVDTITVADLRKVVNDNSSSYYTARDMKTVLKHLFRLASADDWVRKDLPDFITLPELQEKEREPFTADEQAALWKLYESGDRRAAVPLIMIYTGMMPGEALGLKIDMVNFETQQIVGASIKTKVRRKSPIYLPDEIVPILAEECEASTSQKGYVWTHSEKAFYENYYAALAAAGCRKLEPYSCRHTTATALSVTENIAPQTIKKIMRWSTTKMLDKYSHPQDADALAGVNKITARKSTLPNVPINNA